MGSFITTLIFIAIAFHMHNTAYERGYKAGEEFQKRKKRNKKNHL